MNSEEKPLLIIDTDAGTDDALALIMALKNPNWNLIAITSVHGNVSVKQASQNVLKILHYFGKDEIPVYEGCAKSILGHVPDPENTLDYHASDGLGGISKDLKLPSITIQDESAVMALIRLVKKYPKKITLVALGPLTNLAITQRLEETFLHNLKSLILMGGNTEGNGNTTSTAEFNFYCDPEAADVTLRECQCPVLIVGWEVCLKHRLPWVWYEKWLAPVSKTTDFIKRLTAREVEFSKEVIRSDGFLPCDLYAMTALMDPDVMSQCSKHHVSVELHGALTRGLMVVDKRVYSTVKPNAEICEELDMNKIRATWEEMVA